MWKPKVHWYLRGYIPNGISIIIQCRIFPLTGSALMLNMKSSINKIQSKCWIPYPVTFRLKCAILNINRRFFSTSVLLFFTTCIYVNPIWPTHTLILLLICTSSTKYLFFIISRFNVFISLHTVKNKCPCFKLVLIYQFTKPYPCRYKRMRFAELLLIS